MRFPPGVSRRNEPCPSQVSVPAIRPPCRRAEPNEGPPTPAANSRPMLAKAAAIALLLGAALADSGGSHTAAYYLLLGAVPAAAGAALPSLCDLVEHGDRPLVASVVQTVLGVLAVVLVVTTTTS